VFNVTEVDSIFAAAIELSSPEERAEYVQRVCRGDSEMRRRVEQLLAAHFHAGDFLERLPATLPYRSGENIQAGPGTIIGPYKLLQQIGEGGMGIVFMAEQTEPIQRMVALKIIKPGMDTRQVIARFEAERQALAVMDHPNIATVLDAGTTEAGRPYFVMELVKGIPITKYCDEYKLSLRERLELFAPVCQAVQHAHQKGIIHRDIKPTNILVAEYDNHAVPKVIDFGVAKATAQRLTERTMFTEFGQVIGTVEYMSPEQAKFNQLDIDTRSDIYSLGVLLYELLTGSTPFERQRLREAAFDEMLRIIREEDPPKPSTRLSASDALPSIAANRHTEPARLNKAVQGELDSIVMKAIDKDRNVRYATAATLAQDIERYLSNEPVQARSPSSLYRFRKFARRNRLTLLTLAVVAGALLIGATAATWQAIRATSSERVTRETLVDLQRAIAESEQARRGEVQQRTVAAEQRDLAIQRELLVRRHLYAAQMNNAYDAWKQNLSSRGLEILSQYLPKSGEPDFRGFDWYYLWRCWHKEKHLITMNGSFTTVAFHPNSQFVATAVRSSPQVRIFDIESGLQTFLWTCPDVGISRLAFSPDGTMLAAGGFDRKGDGVRPASIRVWEFPTGRVIATLSGHTRSISSLEFSPNGKFMASASSGGLDAKVGAIDGEAKLWDVASHTLLYDFGNYPHGVSQIAFAPNSQRLAAAGYNSSIRVYDTATGKTIAEHPLESALTFCNGITYSPDGELLALTSELWNVDRRKKLDLKIEGEIFSATYSRDGQRLVTGGRFGTVMVFDARTLAVQEVFQGFRHYVHSVAISSNGRFVAAGGEANCVRVWDLKGERASSLPKLHDATADRGVPETRQLLALSHDDNTLALATAGSEITFWDNRTQKPLGKVEHKPGIVMAVAISPDGRFCASGSRGKSASPIFPAYALGPDSPDEEGVIKLWDMRTGAERLTLPHRACYDALAFSPDGKILAAGGWQRNPIKQRNDGVLRLCDAATGRELVKPKLDCGEVADVEFSPDGNLIAIATLRHFLDPTIHPFEISHGEIRVFDITRREWIFRKPLTRNVLAAAFSPDGKCLAAVGNNWKDQNGNVKIWNIEADSELASLGGHAGHVLSVTYAPDGKCMATTGTDGTIRLWDTQTWQQRMSLEWPGQVVERGFFSSDGLTFYASSASGEIRTWRAAAKGEVAAASSIKASGSQKHEATVD
jgi:WD40 repeat protein/serine/threonine protein kinase